MLGQLALIETLDQGRFDDASRFETWLKQSAQRAT